MTGVVISGKEKPMSDTVALTAVAREKVGKGAARAARREGLVPAVIYGDKQPPIPIALPARALEKEINSGRFFTTMYDIDVDGKTTRALPRDVSVHPVRDTAMHVDFLRLAKGASITVAVPVNFLNQEDCPGIKAGGVLNVVRHEVDLDVPADNIPDSIDLDLSKAELGDSLHISAVDLPKGATPTITDRDFTIATIASPAGLKSEESEDEDGEETGAADVPTVSDDESPDED
jgi:large subunit ribosomal protein L25